MRVIYAGVGLAAAGVLLLLIAGPGYRLGLWPYAVGFRMLRYAAYAGVAAAAVSVAGLAIARARPGKALVLALLALAIGAATANVPWYWLRRARSVPPINDITTDVENPPEYVAILPLRADAPNGAEYAGAELAARQLAARQLAAYPNVKPITLAQPAGVAFERALAAARRMGWEIVAADPTALRIEATATTGWFGFKDDIVVRLTPVDAGTRVDVRSHSRVGRSDLGTNARRILAYLARLR